MWRFPSIYHNVGACKKSLAETLCYDDGFPVEATSRASVAALIDHTLLRPEATASEIRKVCAEARQYGFASVCVNPYWASLVTAEIAGSLVKACTVIGFPLGANATFIKVAETIEAIQAGAREIDMVLNIGELRGGNHDGVLRDIRAVVEAAHQGGAIVKVILETALLTDEQKITACGLAKDAGAEFVKTSTGFGPAGATVEDVALLRRAVGSAMGVKASGGIRTLADLQKMLTAGATRVGCSSSVKIIETMAF
jgi:deoxyribose-phosphate aldolase